MQWCRLAVVALTCALFAPAHAGSLDQLRTFLTQTTSARGEFRWSYDKPYEQVIVADGTRLVLYDKDLNQVTIRKLGAALPSSPASILFGSNDFEKEFDV